LAGGYNPTETPLLEYGRTSPEALAASGFNPRDVETAERWRRSPHYRMLQQGVRGVATLHAMTVKEFKSE
jgi:hypothetical protein